MSLDSTVTLSNSTTLSDAITAAENNARLIDQCDYDTVHSWWDTVGRTLPAQFSASNKRFTIRYTRPMVSPESGETPPVFGAIQLRWYAQTSVPFYPDPWTHGKLEPVPDCTPASCAQMYPGEAEWSRDWYQRYMRKMEVKGTSYDLPVDEYHHYCSSPDASDGTFSCDTCDSPGSDGMIVYSAHALDFVLYDPKGTATPGTLEEDLDSTNIRELQTTGNTGWLRLIF